MSKAVVPTSSSACDASRRTDELEGAARVVVADQGNRVSPPTVTHGRIVDGVGSVAEVVEIGKHSHADYDGLPRASWDLMLISLTVTVFHETAR